MTQSSYSEDLSKEQILGPYLDEFYSKAFKDSTYSITRINDLDLQHKGVDLILDNGVKTFNVDEKAQLDYLNKSLPTFVFELSYLKSNSWRKGWLHDENKITNAYFLVNEIMVNEASDLSKGIKSFKLTAIYREKLIMLLNSVGLTAARLTELDKQVRDSKKGGKIKIPELNSTKEGNINFSIGKSEKPINLVLKLKWLTDNGVGGVISLT